MKAKGLMKPVDMTLKPDDGLEEFVRNIQTARSCEGTAGIKALPVVDACGKLSGIISMHDILRAVYPPYLYSADLSLFTWDGMLESLAGKISGKKISQIMTKPVVAVKEDHPLMECVDHMLKYDLAAVPVLDHDDRLVGMLYENDIFFAVADALLGGKAS